MNLLLKTFQRQWKIKTKNCKCVRRCCVFRKNGKWGTLEFKRGRTSTENDPSSGHPKGATKNDIIEKISQNVGRPQIEEWMTLLKSQASHMLSLIHIQMCIRDRYVDRSRNISAHVRSVMCIILLNVFDNPFGKSKRKSVYF